MIKKVLKMNTDGSLGIGIPAQFARDLGITCNDYVNMEKVGSCLHITKVKID